jgi:hypothetical protein
MDTTPKPPIVNLPSAVSVEVYQGDKKQEVKLPEEGAGTN